MNVHFQFKKIWLIRHKVDFRKAHDGLLGEAYRLNLELKPGFSVLFIGRDLRRIKLLYADDNGIWLLYKRFHKGQMKSRFRFIRDPSCHEISHQELGILLSGATYQVGPAVSPWP